MALLGPVPWATNQAESTNEMGVTQVTHLITSVATTGQSGEI